MARMEEDAVFSNLRDKLFTAVVGDVLDKTDMTWRTTTQGSPRCSHLQNGLHG